MFDDGEWDTYGIQYELKNGKKVQLYASEDAYMIGFLSGLYSRDCCSQCAFASTERCSDITMGDFWGIETIIPELDNKITNGTSLMLINTDKGSTLLKELNKNAVLMEMSISDAVTHNSQLHQAQKFHKNRDLFFKYLQKKKSFEKIIKICVPERFPNYNKSFLKKIYSMKWYILLSRIKNRIKR